MPNSNCAMHSLIRVFTVCIVPSVDSENFLKIAKVEILIRLHGWAAYFDSDSFFLTAHLRKISCCIVV